MYRTQITEQKLMNFVEPKDHHETSKLYNRSFNQPTITDPDHPKHFRKWVTTVYHQSSYTGNIINSGV